MQRKRFLVDKKVQGALGFRIATHWLVFFSISIVLTCFLKMPANYAELDPMNSFVDALGNQVASIFVLVALLPWFLYDSLKLSNRFAGPMVRLNKSIVQLGNGEELAPISF